MWNAWSYDPVYPTQAGSTCQDGLKEVEHTNFPSDSHSDLANVVIDSEVLIYVGLDRWNCRLCISPQQLRALNCGEIRGHERWFPWACHMKMMTPPDMLPGLWPCGWGRCDSSAGHTAGTTVLHWDASPDSLPLWKNMTATPWFRPHCVTLK